MTTIITDNIIDFTTRKKNELFYNRSYFAEAEWIDTLGEAAYCLWKKLITRVDRSRDAQAKYGNRNTVPFSLQSLAAHIGMTPKTLYKHARTLWNAGLLDFVEWGTCGKLGKKPLNIVVYNYPQNDTATATKPLKLVRDYEKQYEGGEYPTYLKEESAEIYATQTDEKKAPVYEAPTPEAPPEVEPIMYDDLVEYYATFYENNVEAATHMNMYDLTYTNMEAATHSNMEAATHSNMYDAPYNNIYNTIFNTKANAKLIDSNASKLNANAELISHTPSLINTSEAINTFSSSSSFTSKTKIEVLEPVENEEEENKVNQIANAYKIDFDDIKQVLETVLPTRTVHIETITKIVKLAKEQQLPYVTAALINEQLDHMGIKNECGEPIYSFEKYFVKGLYDRAVASDFYKTNNAMAIAERNRIENEKREAEAPRKKVVFYNWLEEREDTYEAHIAHLNELKAKAHEAQALREAEGI